MNAACFRIVPAHTPLLASLSLCVGFALASPAVAFVTVLSGDEGAVDGVIDRASELHRTGFHYRGNVQDPWGGYILHSSSSFSNSVIEQIVIKNQTDVFSVAMQTVVDGTIGIHRYRYYSEIPTAEEIGLFDAEYRTAQDFYGNPVELPKSGWILDGDPAARANPIIEFELAETSLFSLVVDTVLREEAAEGQGVLRRLGHDGQSSVIANYFAESFLELYSFGATRVTVEDRSVYWRDGRDAVTQARLDEIVALSSRVNTLANRPEIDEDFRFTGTLLPGTYQLELSSRPGDDVNLYPTDAMLRFEVRPIPEPGVLGSLIAVNICAISRRRPGGR